MGIGLLLTNACFTGVSASSAQSSATLTRRGVAPQKNQPVGSLVCPGTVQFEPVCPLIPRLSVLESAGGWLAGEEERKLLTIASFHLHQPGTGRAHCRRRILYRTQNLTLQFLVFVYLTIPVRW
jgi:hypothetical protein